LGLSMYHIVGPQVREALDPKLYDAQVGPMAEALEADAIAQARRVQALTGRGQDWPVEFNPRTDSYDSLAGSGPSAGSRTSIPLLYNSRICASSRLR